MTPRDTLPPPSFFTRRSVRGFLAQLALLLCLAGLLAFFAINASRTVARHSIATGFDFLSSRASFELGSNPIGFRAGDSFFEAFLAGVANTLAVSAASIIIATLLGVLLGIFRLSRNPLARALSGAYVEIVRNVPLLLQMLFWYAIITKALPSPRQALVPVENFFLSNRGFYFPLPEYQPAFFWLFITLVATTALLINARKKISDSTTIGRIVATLWRWKFALGTGLLIIFFIYTGTPTIEVPQLKGFNFSGGGYVTPECTAVFLGLTIYTAAFIAENVRSGILGVGAGQHDAAEAIGLRPVAIMRYVIFPQALRIIVPPLTSQYLNVVKNSSLAVAVGYADIVRVSTIVIS